MSDTPIDAQDRDGSDEEKTQQVKDEALLDKYLAILSEHFEAIQIFTTRSGRGEESGTAMLSRGAGNWYARRGMVEDWIVRQNAETERDVFNRGNE